MALNLTAIREALAATLRASIDRQTNVYAYDPLQQSAQYPRIVIRPALGYIDYTVAQSVGLVDVSLIVSVQVVAADGANEGQMLDEYLSRGVGNNSSIADAIDDDTKLGGRAAFCEITGVEFIQDAENTRADVTVIVRVDS